jgi:hypothetical protein
MQFIHVTRSQGSGTNHGINAQYTQKQNIETTEGAIHLKIKHCKHTTMLLFRR